MAEAVAHPYHGTLRWFGRAFDSPMYEGMPEVPAPIGEPCLMCQEPILEGEPGVTMPHVLSRDGAGEHRLVIKPQHIECHIRSIVGGLDHQAGTCFCVTGEHAPDSGLTYRQESIRVLEQFWGTNWTADEVRSDSNPQPGGRMSESTPEQAPEETQPDTQETEPVGDTNVEADQVVVNQAPDGGGVDNNQESPDSDTNAGSE